MHECSGPSPSADSLRALIRLPAPGDGSVLVARREDPQPGGQQHWDQKGNFKGWRKEKKGNG